jgi:hypothetical protein
MGRDEPKRRRACLYAVIEEMIAAEPQGFLKDDANVERLCGLAQVSRAGFYRRRGPHPPAREGTDLRDLIQRIALAERHYGYRRIAVALGRQGLIVNAKRVLCARITYSAFAPNRSSPSPPTAATTSLSCSI